MPVDVQIIRACEFIRLGARGEFDFESTCEVLRTIAETCHKRGADRALLDVRGATSNLTPKDLAGLVSLFGKSAVSKKLRLAILHTGDQNYRAKLFTFFSAMRGRKVQAVEDFEEALEWLSTPDDPGVETAAAQHEVPIRPGKGSKMRIVVKSEMLKR